MGTTGGPDGAERFDARLKVRFNRIHVTSRQRRLLRSGIKARDVAGPIQLVDKRGVDEVLGPDVAGRRVFLGDDALQVIDFGNEGRSRSGLEQRRVIAEELLHRLAIVDLKIALQQRRDPFPSSSGGTL